MMLVKIGAAVTALALAFLAGSTFTARGKDAEIAEIRRAAAVDQAKATDRARTEEQRRTAAQQENAHEAIKQLRVAQASARAADTARRELLARVTALANSARRPGDSAAIPAGQTTRDPVVLLADVLGRADERAGELAKYADAARIAGQTCERDYEP
ncbi:DUF2514 domain-containing protein [Cupriavidus sp. DB3]|uniref:DUF2514 family protein n=1 Tax=Cupriavidus sp. DB3 TaxID=2873259 RepID=UPI001CF4FFB4|nr:DUF2514 family protein [Cupriavidus sp. DB3]MCA7085856.1 DUF2514 domain-containing protein [Cupriavidus sp. DB3]